MVQQEADGDANAPTVGAEGLGRLAYDLGVHLDDAELQLVRDAIANTVNGGSCTSSQDGVSAIGAKVNVDGSCWEHSHPHSFNVYEMNAW